MNGFIQRIEYEILSRKLFLSGEKILVAVSGGADSIVLLHTLNFLGKKNRWKIFAAHFNHQLRGRASDADENFVRQLAKKLKLKFFTERASVKNFAAQNKLSIEMAARKLRHEFFARVAQKQKIKKIALAHHADDQIELFFLRLFRGAGGEGLAGMKMISPSPAGQKILLVRPLLNFSKKEILDFARVEKISFYDDATNFSSDFLRNRIRNELLPLLQKKYQSAIAKTILRVMEISRAESEFVSETAQNWLKKNLETDFKKLSVALQRKILQQQLLNFGVRADFELIEQLRQSPEKFVSVNSNFSVARDASGRISRKRALPVEKFQNEEFRLKLNEIKFNHKGTKPQSRKKLSTCDFGGRRFFWKIQPQKKFQLSKKVAGERPAPLEIFDADKIGDEIILRHWRAGDRFQPIGFSAAIKLQDFFTNEKITRARRHDLILAATARGEIFWVEGLRISENFKLKPQTKRQLVWQWKI